MSAARVERRLLVSAALLGVVALVVAPAAPAGAQAGDANAGKAVYQLKCIGCHGEKGDGNGKVAWYLDPYPREFTKAAFMNSKPRDRFVASIKEGVVDNIPVDFEIKRAEKLIQAIEPQIDTCRLDVARADRVSSAAGVQSVANLFRREGLTMARNVGFWPGSATDSDIFTVDFGPNLLTASFSAALPHPAIP